MIVANKKEEKRSRSLRKKNDKAVDLGFPVALVRDLKNLSSFSLSLAFLA